MVDEELKQILKNILGKSAFSNPQNMQVSEEVSKLVRGINYLATQLPMAQGKDKDYVNQVIEGTKRILAPNTA